MEFYLFRNNRLIYKMFIKRFKDLGIYKFGSLRGVLITCRPWVVQRYFNNMTPFLNPTIHLYLIRVPDTFVLHDTCLYFIGYDFTRCYILTPLKEISTSRFTETNEDISLASWIPLPTCIRDLYGHPI